MNYLGCHLDHAQTDAVCLALANAGKQPLFGDARSDLKGYGVGKSVFLWEAEEKLFGKALPAFHQSRGTCVSQGTARACQDSLYWALAFGGRLGNPVALSTETIYGGSRVQIGKGQLGRAGNNSNNDGSFGGWAAQFVHDYGLVERKRYGNIDLTAPTERVAVEWGDNGVPKSLLQESAAYKADACFRCTSIEDIRDCIAAGYAVSFCCSTLWQIPDGRSTSRDKEGFCRPVTSGGHCEFVRGTFENKSGEPKFVRQNSWGDYPRGPNVVTTRDGREVTLPTGAYGCHADDLSKALKQRGAEAWAFAPPSNNWRQAA